MKLPSLRDNIIALGAVQFGNALVPLMAVPYLTRVLGVDSYGQVIWVQTIMMFGIIWVDFGFGWSITREISANRKDFARVALLAANVWISQWVLFLLFTIIILSVAWITVGPDKSILYAVGILLVFGQVLLPSWLFQGLETIREMAIIQLIAKILSMPVLFLWVQGPNDQVWALFFFGASSILSGLFAIFWISNRRLILIVRPEWSGMYKVFIDGSELFLTRLMISSYTILIPLAVGWWAGTLQLGYFNLADRLRQAVQAIMAPISQALFPRMSWLFEHDLLSAHLLLRKSALVMLIITASAGAVLSLAADFWMTIFGGSEFTQGAIVLCWLAWVPCLVAISNLIGVQVMLPLGMNKSFSRILISASILSLLLIYPVITNFGALGAAQLMVFVEFVVSGSMAVHLWFHLNKVDEK